MTDSQSYPETAEAMALTTSVIQKAIADFFPAWEPRPDFAGFIARRILGVAQTSPEPDFVEDDYVSPTDITTPEAALKVAAWYWSEARKYRSGHYQNVSEAAFPLEHAAKALEALRVYLPGHRAEGTFSCPICGKDSPHTHSQDETEAALAVSSTSRCTCAAIVNPNIPHARTCPLSSTEGNTP